MFDHFLQTVVAGGFLNTEEAYRAAKMLLHDNIPEYKAAAFLSSIRTRREESEEIAGFVQALAEEAHTIETDLDVIDTCGTGGDGLSTFNISTAAALVVAGCGVPVAKHGNRAVTGKVGSADLMEALGVNINLNPQEARLMLEKIGITFLFAPLYHPILKQIAEFRRNLRFPTIFNLLGPLLNPCPLTYQVMGISDYMMHKTMAKVLQQLGRKRAMAVHAENGMDEISPLGKTHIYEVETDVLHSYKIDAVELGFHNISLDMLRGGSITRNVQVITDILDGVAGAPRHAVALNAAAALMTAGKAASINEGIDLAYEAIDSGKAKAKLKNMISFSRDEVLIC